MTSSLFVLYISIYSFFLGTYPIFTLSPFSFIVSIFSLVQPQQQPHDPTPKYLLLHRQPPGLAWKIDFSLAVVFASEPPSLSFQIKDLTLTQSHAFNTGSKVGLWKVNQIPPYRKSMTCNPLWTTNLLAKRKAIGIPLARLVKTSKPVLPTPTHKR